MSLTFDSGHQSRDCTLPTAHTEIQSSDVTPISSDVVKPLSQGDHHIGANTPTSGTPLPNKQTLLHVIDSIQSYMRVIGMSVLSTAQLNGVAAPVHMTDTGRMYAYVDRELFENIMRQAVTDDVSLTEELIEAVVLSHSMQFQSDISTIGINPDREATWSTVTGNQTTDTVELIFVVPHPLQSLNTHSVLQERAVGLVSGIQNLTHDITGVYQQSDVALPYIEAYLCSTNMTNTQAVSELHTLYGVPQNVITSVIETIRSELSNGYPVSNPEYRYCLTTTASEKLTP
jgi:hypothetical protein